MCLYTAFWTVVTGTQTSVVATLTSIIFLPSVSLTHLLLRKICEEADGKERATVTFFASEDRHRALLVGPYDSVMFSGQPELSSTLSCIHKQEGVTAELFTYYCPAICVALSQSSFWFLNYKVSLKFKCMYVSWEILQKQKAFLLACNFPPCRHWLERKLVISPSAAVVVRSFTLELR